jgi:DNA (cytosine-5)-methyltransferase 1
MSTTFIDLFCGAGGLSLGLQRAGWKPLLALDNWSDAAKTYVHNFTEHACLEQDVGTLSGRAIRDAAGERPQWVVGGPPCQGFSTVGKRIKSDERNLLIREFVRLVAQIKPEGVLVENVVGLKDMNFVGIIVKMFADVGYRVTPTVVRAADFGVPQLRHRIFFVGTRDGSAFVPPRPTNQKAEYVTVWDAIGDLPPLQPGASAVEYVRDPFTAFQQRMRGRSQTLQGHEASRHPDNLVSAISFIPDGGNRRHIPDELQPRSGYHNSYSRLHSASPAVAVTQNMGKPSGTRCIHPFQHRGLTAREGARLQSFPDSFHFLGGITSQRLQIANAVPPLLAEQMGKALVAPEAWKDEAPEVTWEHTPHEQSILQAVG